MEAVSMQMTQSKCRSIRNLLLILIGSLCGANPCLVWAQQAPSSGSATTSGTCSLANSGQIGTVKYTCGIGARQGAEILKILNKILANQLDPEAVMKKLDEILHAVNPNLAAKTYFCDGHWRTAGPSATAAFDVSMGGRRRCVQRND